MRRRAWLSQAPSGRVENRRELIVRALVEPFNLIVLAGMLVAGAILGALPLTIPFAAAVYAVAVAWSYRREDPRRGGLARLPSPGPSGDLSTHPPKRARPDA
jgi:hypothetical protein